MFHGNDMLQTFTFYSVYNFRRLGHFQIEYYNTLCLHRLLHFFSDLSPFKSAVIHFGFDLALTLL